jgi:prepilin-type N-terminal cleavage/methylation domain-containing protein
MTIDRRRAAAGFTLIETIVALVILSTALIAFYSLLSTLLNSAGRLQAASIAYDRRLNALELATTLNPMLAPQGRFDLGLYRISWTSQLIDKVRRSSRYPAGQGVYEVALYRVTLAFPDEASVPPVTVTRLGYRRVDMPATLSAAAPP